MRTSCPRRHESMVVYVHPSTHLAPIYHSKQHTVAVVVFSFSFHHSTQKGVLGSRECLPLQRKDLGSWGMNQPTRTMRRESNLCRGEWAWSESFVFFQKWTVSKEKEKENELFWKLFVFQKEPEKENRKMKEKCYITGAQQACLPKHELSLVQVLHETCQNARAACL